MTSEKKLRNMVILKRETKPPSTSPRVNLLTSENKNGQINGMDEYDPLYDASQMKSFIDSDLPNNL